MMHRSLALLLLATHLPAQTGVMPALPSTPQMRFVDFSLDLARPGVAVVVGRLGKGKEGKRERLADANLGGGNAVSQVSGTQYFKVPVQAAVAPRAVLFGKAEKLQLQFDVQVARLPDGKERRQAMTGNGAPLGDDQLALFVAAPKAKGKGFELLHVIPFDAAVDKGPDAELRFADTMHDYCAVNRRMHDLRAAMAAVDGATDAAAKQAALDALKELLGKELALRQDQNEPLRMQHVNPVEARAQKLLDAGKDGDRKG